jgi:hypothetical protein
MACVSIQPRPPARYPHRSAIPARLARQALENEFGSSSIASAFRSRSCAASRASSTTATSSGVTSVSSSKIGAIDARAATMRVASG